MRNPENKQTAVTSLINLENLDIGYVKPASKLLTLLCDITLTVRTGEIIGLLGRNGSGKSTLLRTIAGLHHPLKGKVLINEQTVHELSGIVRAKLIGYVSTEQINADHISVSELVTLGRFPYTNWIGTLSDDDKKIINNALNMTGIYELRDKMINKLSDGERQKTMIARALAQNTAIIVLDEPTAFLDLPNRYHILRLLNELAHIHQKTIIYSTHDLNIALNESDKLWLINNGKILEGAPEDLIITKGFHKLFENSDIDFNNNTSEIFMRRTYIGNIHVQGDRELNYWTGRALERLGLLSAGDKPALASVITGFKDNKAFWSLHYMNTIQDFYSVYDLVSGIKNILNKTKNN